MKKKFSGRIVALAIVVIMLLGVLPASAADLWTEYKVIDPATQTPDTENFSWSAGWRILNREDVWTGYSYECYDNGQNVSFEFNGTGLKVNAFVNTQDIGGDGTLDSCVNNNVTISIDGGEPQLLNSVAQTTTVAHMDVFEVTGLSYGDHTAVIRCGNYSAPAISGSFYLNSVSVLNGSMGKLEVSWSDMTYAIEGNGLNSDYFAYSTYWNTVNGLAQAVSGSDSASFYFNGTGLQIYANVNTQDIGGDGTMDSCVNNNVYISIDGSEKQQLQMVDATKTPGTNNLVYEIKGLGEGTHTAVITTEQYTAPAISNEFYFQGVKVANGSLIKQPSWSSIYKAASEEVNADNQNLPNSKYFTYSEHWRDINTVDDTYETWLAGQTATFTFEGTGLQIFAFVNTQDREGNGFGVGVDTYVNNNVTVSIDGGAPKPLNMVRNSHTVGNMEVFSVVGLENGAHTAVITNGQSASNDTGFYFQGVKVADGTLKPIVSWSEMYYADVDGAANEDYFNFESEIGWRNTITPGYQESFVPGDSATFMFNGTGIQVYAQANVQDLFNADGSFNASGDGTLDILTNNNVYISIDGGAKQQLKSYITNVAPGTEAVVFEVADLAQGEHTAVITTEQYTSPSVTNSFYLKGIKVANGTATPLEKWGEEIIAVDRNDTPSTAFAFTGIAWNVFSDGTNKFMHAGAAGGNADFAFNGTGFRILACVNVQNGESLNNDEIYVSVDGGEFEKADMWVDATPGSIAVVYEVKNLPEGTHTVAIENRARTSQWGAQFFFHGVQLWDDGYMVSPPQWSEIIRAVSDTHVINPDYSYTGNWSDQSPRMRAVSEGDKVDFTIDGNGLKIYAMVNVQPNNNGGWICYNNDVVYVSIDGGQPVPMNMYLEGVVADAAVYSIQGLADGEHTVTITNGVNNKGNNKEFYFHGVSVLNGDLVDARGEILSLEVEQMPEKLYYGENTEIDLTGLKLKANNNDDYIIEPNIKSVGINLTPVEGKYYVSTENPDVVQEIVCTYKDVEFILPLTYYTVNNIEVTSLPKTEYELKDDHFVTSGGEISITLGGENVAEKLVAKELLKVNMIKTAFPAQKACGQTLALECEYLNTEFSYDITFVNSMGDINGDGVINNDDLVLLINFLIGEENTSLTPLALAAAELDGVSGVTMNDATVLAKAIATGVAPEKVQPNLANTQEPTSDELAPNVQGDITITKNNVRHIGRTYYNDQLNGYNFNWSCSGFEFNFSGTKAEIELIGDTIFDNSTYPLIQVFVDGEDTPSKVLTLSGSKTWYTLAEGLEEGEHTIKILKQNQTAYSSALATSLKVDGELLAPNSCKSFGIQIIGDSISAGMFNETEGLYEGSYVLAEENSYNTSYAMLARKLNADFTIFANSGAACNESAGPVRRDVQVGRAVTDQYRYTDLFWGYEGELQEDNTRTDLIIINLGTNDRDYIGANPERKQAFVDAYVELLRYLRERYPEAPIVCTYGIIMTSPSDLIEQAVNTVKVEDGDTNVYFHMEDTLTHSGHPRVADNIEYANKLLAWLEAEGII